jgi:ribosomal protein S18 acetylase RimI-like enzyme
LIDIALLPQYRNQGIGSTLLRELLADAARAGCAVSLKVENTNPAARLYERLGFQTVDEDGMYALKVASIRQYDPGAGLP